MILSYYLPQFHEVEENNLWWGKGFTEWTKVNEAISYFENHNIRKPIEPLGQYNLLDIDVIEKQYSIAKSHGIDGFMIWNYWFGNNEKILEKPLEIIHKTKAKVKYCLAWANHSWLNKSKGVLLKEQQYLGEKDYIDYFNYLVDFFKSDQYIKINNKPIFTIFRPQDIKDLDIFLEVFNSLAKKHGFDGVYWIAENTDINALYVQKFDKYLNSSDFLALRKYKKITYLVEIVNNFTKGRLKLGPFIYSYKKMVDMDRQFLSSCKEIPVIFTGWDTSIRHSTNGIILKDFDINSFEYHVNKKLELSTDFIIVKSWNEWAEGNILEPDNLLGDNLLKTIKLGKQRYE